MFRLSKGAEYAIRGLVYLGSHIKRQVIPITEVSRVENISLSFIIKVFQSLARKGLLRSSRGTEGGFSLAKPAREISLLEIIEGVEGPISLNECLLKHELCSKEKDCPFYIVWQEAQEKLQIHLKSYTLADLVNMGKKKT